MTRQQRYYNRHKEKILQRKKEYYDTHEEEFKKYYQDHKEKILKNRQDYHKKYRKILLAYKRTYYQKNKICLIDHIRDYRNARLSFDVQFKLQHYLRARLFRALKGNYKSGSAVKDLGCSVGFFKDYIQSKFYGNMSWNNWGKVWELDHIVPLHTFDLTDRNQFLKAVNYKNLQPLTIEDHREKSTSERNLI